MGSLDDDALGTRTFKEVLETFCAADDPFDWLRYEVAEYLRDEVDDEALDASVEQLMENVAAVDAADVDDLDPDELLAFVVSCDTGEEMLYRTLRQPPHPVDLLWLLANNAEPGQEVTVEHVFASSVATVSLRWPFDMTTAVLLTSPDPRSTYAELLAASASASRSVGEPRGELVKVEVPLPAVVAAAVAGGLLVAAGVLLGKHR